MPTARDCCANPARGGGKKSERAKRTSVSASIPRKAPTAVLTNRAPAPGAQPARASRCARAAEGAAGRDEARTVESADRRASQRGVASERWELRRARPSRVGWLAPAQVQEARVGARQAPARARADHSVQAEVRRAALNTRPRDEAGAAGAARGPRDGLLLTQHARRLVLVHRLADDARPLQLQVDRVQLALPCLGAAGEAEGSLAVAGRSASGGDPVGRRWA